MKLRNLCIQTNKDVQNNTETGIIMPPNMLCIPEVTKVKSVDSGQIFKDLDPKI